MSVAGMVLPSVTFDATRQVLIPMRHFRMLCSNSAIVSIPFDHPIVTESTYLQQILSVPTIIDMDPNTDPHNYGGSTQDIFVPAMLSQGAVSAALSFAEYHSDPDKPYPVFEKPLRSANMAELVCQFDVDLISVRCNEENN